MDMKVRITKEFTFEMAHLLTDYDGLCRNIHGHSYKLLVTVRGEAESDPSSPKLGMLMDFSVLKRIVCDEVVDRLDHALVVREGTPQAERLAGVADRIYLIGYQPTCENMVCDFAARIGRRMPGGVELYSLRLHETATSYAEWFACDN